MQRTEDFARQAPDFELTFRSLSHSGKGYAFPCDAAGDVDLDALSEVGRAHYFFARGAVGADFCTPKVVQVMVGRRVAAPGRQALLNDR